MTANVLAALALSSLALGCAQQPTAELPPVETGETDDTLANFNVVPEVLDEAHIAELSADGDLVGAVTVSYGDKVDGKRDAYISGTLVEIDASAEQITIDLDGSWNPFATNYRFYFYTRAAGSDDAWRQYQFSYPGRSYARYDSFDEAELNIADSEFRTDPEGDGFSVDFGNDLPADGKSLEYAVFVVPQYKILGTLEGTHEYRLQVRCDGTACAQAAAN
ncbi:MAG: hypothetical protein KJO07_05700 [Deltaproteobacteria bacterium]|nr:hypothetical protein [Deltaproteobacteria bacterium]